jgi:hypothetical protein
MTKRRFASEIKKLYDSAAQKDGGTLEPEAKKAAEMLKDLPVNSTVVYPEGVYDKKTTYTKKDDGKWYCSDDPIPFTDTDIGWDLMNEESMRPYVSKVAMSPEEYEEANRKWTESYWRNKASVWAEDESLSTKAQVSLRKEDYDHAGEGTVVTAKDGTKYQKIGGEWYNQETWEKADKRKLGSATFEGDFFETNFGLNGISAEECAKMRETYEAMPDSLKAKYEKVFRETKFTTTDETSYYNAINGNICIGECADSSTILHESSHALDNGALDKTIKNSLGTVKVTSASQNIDILSKNDRQSDFEAMAKVVGIKTNGKGWFAETNDDGTPYTGKLLDSYLKWGREYSDSTPGFDAVSDAISGITLDSMGESYSYGGHSSSYWQQPYGGTLASHQSREYWANYCMLKAKGYTDALELLKKVTPGKYAAAEQTYKEVFGDE